MLLLFLFAYLGVGNFRLQFTMSARIRFWAEVKRGSSHFNLRSHKNALQLLAAAIDAPNECLWNAICNVIVVVVVRQQIGRDEEL